MSSVRRPAGLLVAVIGLTLALASPAAASHSWGSYHWARTSNPFTVKLGDNVSGLWDNMLISASSDWSASTVLDTTIVAGGTSAKQCRATAGRVEVCSANYGGRGWLGVAQIWLSGSHITQGTVKNNDYYFGSSSYQYNNTAEMRHVICQEIGHTFGLGHTSEDGSSQNTCMDYYHNTSASDTQSTSPNQHDYDQLASIYSHLDSTNTTSSAPAGAGNGHAADASNWGRLVASSNGGREQTFRQDLGNNQSIMTFVIWAR
ncbi:MAG: hypothetical protein ABIP53_01275 [Candidatus Limnocylindrales bacterium]